MHSLHSLSLSHLPALSPTHSLAHTTIYPEPPLITAATEPPIGSRLTHCYCDCLAQPVDRVAKHDSLLYPPQGKRREASADSGSTCIKSWSQAAVVDQAETMHGPGSPSSSAAFIRRRRAIIGLVVVRLLLWPTRRSPHHRRRCSSPSTATLGVPRCVSGAQQRIRNGTGRRRSMGNSNETECSVSLAGNACERDSRCQCSEMSNCCCFTTRPRNVHGVGRSAPNWFTPLQRDDQHSQRHF